MKRVALLACCVLTGCPGTKTGSPPSGACRIGDAPKSCVHPPASGMPQIGANQGPFLEGSGLERLHFEAHGAFPPKPGTKLHATAACGDTPKPIVTIVQCADVPTGQGFASCQVDVEKSKGICTSLTPGGSVRDSHPTLHRGVTLVRGLWDATGAWHDTPDTVTLSCDAEGNAPDVEQFDIADGAITKCVRTMKLDPAKLEEAFLACIRMIRADYCGDGMPRTLRDTNVGVATPNDPMTPGECGDQRCFEASWSRDGAVCVAHVRWAGAGMGLEACADQFTPAGGMSCRGKADRAVLSSRSQRNVCGRFAPDPCGPDHDPVCAQ
jgi:hypothetical protein